MRNTFGKKLRTIREERGWTLEDMAKYLNTTKQALSRYERGERTPKITIAAQFADVLHVPLEALVEEETVNEAVQPKTEEAKTISRWIDKLPQEQRQQAMSMLKIMFGDRL